MKFIILLIFNVASDEMYWIDYSTDSEYLWDSLQQENDYTIEDGDDIIKFNFGKDLKETCGGQSASAIKFSKAGDHCRIIGRHEFIYFSAYTIFDLRAIAIFYEGGDLCRDSLWGDIKSRIEFKLVCNPIESDFFFLSHIPFLHFTFLEEYVAK